MAGKSQVQQQVDDLEKLVARIIERSDNLRKEVDEYKTICFDLAHDLGEVRTNIAVLSRDLDEVRRNVEKMKQQRKEAGHQWWMLAPPIGGAIVSVVLSALITYLLTRK